MAKRAAAPEDHDEVPVKRPKGFLKSFKDVLKWKDTPSSLTVACEDACSFCQKKFISESLYQCQVCTAHFCSVCCLNL